MLGFKTDFSSSEAKKHRDHLLKRVPPEYKAEVDQIYEWMTNDIFLEALRSQTIEQWYFCKRAMTNPPLMFIEDQILKCRHVEYNAPKYPTPHVNKPKCHLCNEELAESVVDKIKFSSLSCSCGTLFCHTKCGEKYMAKTPSCYMCKHYYVYQVKNTPLITTIVNH